MAGDDALTVYAGELGQVLVLENDVGPDGEPVRVCDTRDGRDEGLRYRYLDGALMVEAGLRAEPGDHDLSYTACAGTAKERADVRVTVLERPAVTVVRTSQPGRLRVTNPADVAIRVDYGHVDDDNMGPDGHLRVGPGGSREFTVQRHTIRWTAFGGPADGPSFGSDGRVTGIELPPGVEPLPGPRRARCSSS
ncbi:hypothetical protein ACFP8W_26025, partial [Nocardioides hankookensis]